MQQVLEVVHGDVATVLEVIIEQHGLGGVEGDVFTGELARLQLLQLLADAIEVILGLGLEQRAQLNVEDTKGGVFTAFQLIPEGGVHEGLQQHFAVGIISFIIVIPPS